MPSLHALSLLLLVAAPATALAQTAIGPGQAPAPAVFFAARTPGPLDHTLAAADTLRPQSIGTYAKEGAIVGGLLGAVGVGFLAQVACGLSESTTKSCTGNFLLGGVIGAAFGALPGALIGGLFPKYPKNTRVVHSEGQ